MPELQNIKNRLRNLATVDGVSVNVTDAGKTVKITHKTHHSLDFSFRWIDDSHFVGYSLDCDGKKSQAVLALWTSMDAMKFVVSYANLLELRARQR